MLNATAINTMLTIMRTSLTLIVTTRKKRAMTARQVAQLDVTPAWGTSQRGLKNNLVPPQIFIKIELTTTHPYELKVTVKCISLTDV